MRRIRRCIALSIVILAVVLPAAGLAGCGSGEKMYTDSTYGYTFRYPGGWKVQAGTTDVTAGGIAAGNAGVYDPNGTRVGDTFVDLAMVTVYNLSFTVDDPWSPEIHAELETVLAHLEDQTTDLKVEKPLSQTTVADLKGYSVTYTFTKEGTPLRSTLHFVFDEDREYELTQQAAISTWETAKPALERIIESFEPGRAG